MESVITYNYSSELVRSRLINCSQDVTPKHLRPHHHRITEPWNTPSWKGPARIAEPSSWLHTALPQSSGRMSESTGQTLLRLHRLGAVTASLGSLSRRGRPPGAGPLSAAQPRARTPRHGRAPVPSRTAKGKAPTAGATTGVDKNGGAAQIKRDTKRRPYRAYCTYKTGRKEPRTTPASPPGTFAVPEHRTRLTARPQR